MSNFIKSRLNTIRTTLLVSTLLATPIVVLIAQTGKTFADDDKAVCVTAVWKSDPAIVSKSGKCFDAVVDAPVGYSTASPTATSGATATPIPTSDVTASMPATTAAEITPTPTPTPTPTIITTPSATPTPTYDGTPTPTASSDPSPLASPTSSATVSPSPTITPDATVSPTPTASSPVVPPEPDPIPIPPENTDPKTKDFRFCHNGGMLSNSYTGMMSGHHGNHPEDIIPPIPFKFYGGWNWNATNAKTFYNNCIPVK